MEKRFSISLLFFCVLLFACTSGERNQRDQPIVLGDSSTIVTETDSNYLQNTVMDIRTQPYFAEPSREPTQTKATEAGTPPASVPAERGFQIDFGGFRALFTGIETKEFRSQDPKGDYGVSYKVIKGDLTNSELVFSGVQSIEVNQRYQSSLQIKGKDATLDLQRLGLFTSEWQVKNPASNSQEVRIPLSDLKKIQFKDVGLPALKQAVQHELRQMRASAKTTQEWNRRLSRLKSAKDPSVQVVLNNAQWRITGKDAQGNAFSKLIRIDGL